MGVAGSGTAVLTAGTGDGASVGVLGNEEDSTGGTGVAVGSFGLGISVGVEVLSGVGESTAWPGVPVAISEFMGVASPGVDSAVGAGITFAGLGRGLWERREKMKTPSIKAINRPMPKE